MKDSHIKLIELLNQVSEQINIVAEDIPELQEIYWDAGDILNRAIDTVKEAE